MEHPRATTRDFSLRYLGGMKAVLDALPLDGVDTLIAYLSDAYQHGKQVFVVGNGGSAATASHMACDLAKTVLGKATDRQDRRFKVIALTDNVPLITAWGNDVSYDTVFAEQLRNLANPGDVLLVITGSGNSPNIVQAVRAARELGVTSIGLLGFDGGSVRTLLDHYVIVASRSYGYVEDAHMVLNHLITAYFKESQEDPRLRLHTSAAAAAR
jgi:D-sedoheptulose 7-phosphate isomerase